MNEQGINNLYIEKIISLSKIVDAINNSTYCVNEDDFRQKVELEINDLILILNQNLEKNSVDKIVMAVCALLDEIIIKNLSNIYESWVSFSLQGIYFKRTDCGSIVSDEMESLSINNEILLNKTVMYFYLWCLKLGFLGRFSIVEAMKLIVIYENKLELTKKKIPLIYVKEKPSFILKFFLYVVMSVFIIVFLLCFNQYLSH